MQESRIVRNLALEFLGFELKFLNFGLALLQSWIFMNYYLFFFFENIATNHSYYLRLLN